MGISIHVKEMYGGLETRMYLDYVNFAVLDVRSKIVTIDNTFFCAKHSGSISEMLRNNISRGTLVLLYTRTMFL